MKRKGNTTQLQVSIPKELMADLKGLAKKEKRSTSNLVSLLLSGEMKEMRTSQNEYDKTGRLINGHDYENQAWVINGKYVRCGHPESMDCGCYGKEHEGEETK